MHHTYYGPSKIKYLIELKNGEEREPSDLVFNVGQATGFVS